MGLSQNQDLYFIAILPNEEIKTDITAFKNHMAEKYFSRHALKSPPHITLIPPFKWDRTNEGKLTELLDEFSASQQQFSLQLENFDAFKPRVIFVDIVNNPDLESIHDKINANFQSVLGLENVKRGKKFSPHMTIAFKDLKRKMFYKAWDEFKEKKYTAEFEVNRITLLHHNGKKWGIIHDSPLVN